MDVRIEMGVKIEATRTGGGMPKYDELQKFLWDAVELGIAKANLSLAENKVPFRIRVMEKEVLSR